MYTASQEFHAAVANGAHQIALLIFDDAVFTNDDIDVSAGIEFNDYFNTEEDITIGQALSNEISFNLFNDSGLLDDYEFGDFTATIGAQIENETVTPVTPPYDPSSTTLEIIREPDDYIGEYGSTASFSVVATGVTAYQWQYSTNGSSWSTSGATGNKTASMSIEMTIARYAYSYRCRLTGASGTIYTRPVRMAVPGELIYVESGIHNYTAYARSPYIRRDKGLASVQLTSAARSMLIYGDYLYMLLTDGTVKKYAVASGIEQTVTMNDFMKAQMAKWAGEGIAYTKASGENWKLRIWKGTTRRTYEFVPLGVFNAERPNVPTVNLIHFTCYDLMQRFEKDMPENVTLDMTYPSTISNLFVKMCQHLNVPYGNTGFINGTATISARPDEFKNTTMREVLQWIAEAAGSVARFNRDGTLVMDWLRTTTHTLNENQYSEFNPYWYETKQFTKVNNRASDGTYENINGTGTETYLIQDNPLLKGVS